MLQNNNQNYHVHVLNNMMNCIDIKLKTHLQTFFELPFFYTIIK
jgi:hypothetical protein